MLMRSLGVPKPKNVRASGGVPPCCWAPGHRTDTYIDIEIAIAIQHN